MIEREGLFSSSYSPFFFLYHHPFSPSPFLPFSSHVFSYSSSLSQFLHFPSLVLPFSIFILPFSLYTFLLPFSASPLLHFPSPISPFLHFFLPFSLSRLSLFPSSYPLPVSPSPHLSKMISSEAQSCCRGTRRPVITLCVLRVLAGRELLSFSLSLFRFIYLLLFSVSS